VITARAMPALLHPSPACHDLPVTIRNDFADALAFRAVTKLLPGLLADAIAFAGLRACSKSAGVSRPLAREPSEIAGMSAAATAAFCRRLGQRGTESHPAAGARWSGRSAAIPVSSSESLPSASVWEVLGGAALLWLRDA
jgi:hypothetical protein